MMGGPFRFGSVCSGIEAASVAWHPLGWRAAWLAEIDPQPSAVLAHRYPEVPNLGDFTKIGDESGPVDLLVGGTPCQSFSVAGRRLGLDDPRGNLAIEFLRLARRLRPRWLVWENVPGILSSSGGRDFGAFLGLLGECGYGWAYRVLDAQYFGVPQRRRRVFVVGHLGDWRRAVAVLFERESLSGNPPPRRPAGTGVAPSVTPGARRASGARSGEQLTVGAIDSNPYGDRDSRHAMLVAHTLRAEGFDASEDGTGRGTPLVPAAYQCHGSDVGKMGTVRAGRGDVQSGVPFIVNAAESCAVRSHARPSEVARCLDSTGSFATSQGGTVVACDLRNLNETGDVAQTLQVGGHGVSPSNHPHVVATFDPRNVTSKANRTRVETNLPCQTLHAEPMHVIGAGVRRLTPLECERLQGFPDNWTLVPVKPVPAKSQAKARALAEAGDERFADIDGVICVMTADGPRYRMVGNSMAIPPLMWLGEGIAMVDLLPA